MTTKPLVLRKIERLAGRRTRLEGQLEAVREELAECFIEGNGQVPVKHMADAAQLTRENVYYWLRKAK